MLKLKKSVKLPLIATACWRGAGYTLNMILPLGRSQLRLNTTSSHTYSTHR